MKINRHSYIYQNKENWRDRIKILKAFNTKYEAEIKHHQLEYVKLIDDYNGKPVREDNLGQSQDWFHRLYHLKYKTKLRILPA